MIQVDAREEPTTASTDQISSRVNEISSAEIEETSPARGLVSAQEVDEGDEDEAYMDPNHVC